MEPLQNVSVVPSEARKRKVDLHIRVPEEYGSSSRTHSTNAQAIHARRIAREKNIDLWVDGHLYPIDPPLQTNPPFHNLSSFVQFVGDGELGLLGYCKRLTMVGAWQNHMLHSQLQATQLALVQCQEGLKTSSEKMKEILIETEKKDAKLQKLEDIIKRLKATPTGARERKKSLSSIQNLALKGGARKKRIRATK